MEIFTVRTPWWLLRLRGRNPLVRSIDRVEALTLVLAVVVTMLAVPVAGAIGTAVYDAGGHGAQTAAGAIVTALVIWGSAATAATIAFLGVRRFCDRKRSRSWQNGVDVLIDRASGRDQM